MTTRPGLKSIIEYEGLSEKVTDWIFNLKLSYNEIRKKLLEEYGIEITEPSIGNFKKTVLKTTEEFLRDDKEYRDKVAKKLLDSVENLAFAIDEITKSIEEATAPKEWKKKARFLQLLLNECQMLLRRAGEIKPTQIIEKQITNIQINEIVQLQMVKVIEEEFMKEDGTIDIERIKEFLRKMKENAIPS